MKKNNSELKKKNISSIQVMKTLQVLMQGEYTMDELVEILNKKEKTPIFNNSVISKYINTCRYCGISIPKIQNKYIVTNVPFGLNMTDTDYDLINELQLTAQKDMSVRTNKAFIKFLEKINRFSNKRIVRVETDTRDISCKLFEKSIQNNNKVRLFLKNKSVIDCIPLNITEYKKRIFFNVFYENKERMIGTDRISGLEILQEKFKQFHMDTTVIFKLKGDLSQKYQLREHENVINDKRPDYIVIANRGENKEILFARLLRYQNLCEIEHPSYYRSEFKDIIDDTLSNYGV